MVAIGGIILAAGQSQRFGTQNKLLSDYQGRPLITYTLACVRALNLSETIVVTGHDAHAVTPYAKTYRLPTIHNPNFKSGMGTSIAVGVTALSTSLDAYLIFLSDMPHITPDLVTTLTAAFESSDHASIIRPTFNKKPGHPVLIPAKYCHELCQLRSDTGLRDLLRSGVIPSIEIQSPTKSCLRDIDHP